MADTIEKKVIIDIEILNKASKEITELTAEIKSLQITQAKLKVENKETSAEFIQNANAIKVYSNRIKEINKDMVNHILMNQSSSGYLTALKAEVSSLTIAYNRLKEAEMDSAAGKELQTKILTLTDTLNKAEQATGNYRRQVGNYAQANSRLSFSMAQIIREAPVAAMRMDMFFLAISNNIPMLADEIKKMKDLNVQLKANGEATQSVAKAVVKSLFTFNTAMMIGVTLLTMYGGKIIEWLGNLGSAASKAQKIIDDVITKGFDSSSEQITKLQLLRNEFNKLDSLQDKTKFLNKYKEELKGVGIEVDNVTELEAILSSDTNTQKYVDSLIKKEQAQASFTEMVKLSGDIQKLKFEREQILAKQSIGFWNAYWNSVKSFFQGKGLLSMAGAVKAEVKDIDKEIRDAQQKIQGLKGKFDISSVLKSNTNNTNTEINNATNIANSLLDTQKDAAISAIKAEEEYQSEDFALKQAYAKRIFELEQTYAKKKIDEDLNNKEITIEQSKLKEEELLNQKTEFNNKQKAEQEKYNLEEQKKLDEQQKKLLDLLSDYGEDQIKAINDKWDNYIKDFSKTLAPPKNNVEAWKEWALKISMFTFAANKKRAEEIAKYNEGINDKETKERLEALNKQLVDEDKTLKEKFDLKMAYFNQEIALANKDATLQAQLQKDKLKTEKEYYRERGKLATDYASEVLNVLTAINDFANAQSESELQDYETKNEEKKASLDNQLQQGLISQQEYDNQVAAMDKDLDKKKAKLAREQAAREKLLKIFEITINTASAIMKAAPNIPLQILTGIAGAAQLATVIATPIPKAARGKYIKGNSHAQGGTMIEAEDGEVIINKVSTAQNLPLLSAINVAGGGVPFGNFTDGGFAMRNDKGSVLDTTTLERAIKDMQIVVSVEDINRGQKNYAKVIDRASF